MMAAAAKNDFASRARSFRERGWEQRFSRGFIAFKLAHETARGGLYKVQSEAVSSKMHGRDHFIPQVSMTILNTLLGKGPRSPHSIHHKGKRLSEILEAHARFVRGADSGVRADLAGADLSRANLE